MMLHLLHSLRKMEREFDVIKGSCDAVHNKYDVINIVCVMSSRECVWYIWYTGFDDTDIVDAVSDIVGKMADITFGMSCVWCHI